MKSIKSFWGQMHQKWFGPKIKDEKDKPKKSPSVATKSDPWWQSVPKYQTSTVEVLSKYCGEKCNSLNNT